VYRVVPAARAFAAARGAIAAGLYEFTRSSGISAGAAARASTWIRVRALLRRLEHRTDADAGALGVMSVTWMSVIAVLVLAQKLLPAKAAIDVPLAVAIVGLES
jgi:hypothetical protein